MFIYRKNVILEDKKYRIGVNFCCDEKMVGQGACRGN